MKPSRFTEKQIIGMLRKQEAGAKTADVCRKYGIPLAGRLRTWSDVIDCDAVFAEFSFRECNGTGAALRFWQSQVWQRRICRRCHTHT